jgi:hypothetical protein
LVHSKKLHSLCCSSTLLLRHLRAQFQLVTFGRSL